MTNGASLYTAHTAFSYLLWPSDSSLQQVIVDRGCTWTLGGNGAIEGGTYGGDGRIVLRGGTITGGTIYPRYGITVSVKASDTNSTLNSTFSSYSARPCPKRSACCCSIDRAMVVFSGT